jgi:hypothetical protein
MGRAYAIGRIGIVAAGLLAGAGSAFAGEAYTLTVSAPTSAVTYSFNASAPFSATIAGDPMPVQPPAPAPAVLPSRLKRGTTGFICVFTNNCTSIAANVNETSAFTGTLAGSGSNASTTPQRPTGTYTIAINPGAGTAEARDINLNLVGSTPIVTSASINEFAASPPFCLALGTSTAPACTVFSCAIPSVPLGSVSITSIAVTAPGPAAGTLTPVAGDPASFDFNIPVLATVATTQTFQGSVFPSDPQTVPIVLSGRITRTGQGSGAGATATTSFSASSAPPTNTTPSPLGAQQLLLPADSPLCANVPVIVNLTLTSTSTSVNTSATLNASGPRLRCPADIDTDGVRTVDDIFVFLNLWFASDPRANFDGMGGITIDDIFIFLNAWFAAPFPC